MSEFWLSEERLARLLPNDTRRWMPGASSSSAVWTTALVGRRHRRAT